MPETLKLLRRLTGNLNYAAATGSAQSFIVGQATTTISVKNIPGNAKVGESFTPTYVYASNRTKSVTSNTTATCTVSRGTVKFVAAGPCSLVAHATATADYSAATESAQSFAVK